MAVCRKLKQNSDKRSEKYNSNLSQQKYEQRLKTKPKHIYFTGKIRQKGDTLLLYKNIVQRRVLTMKEKSGKEITCQLTNLTNNFTTIFSYFYHFGE